MKKILICLSSLNYGGMETVVLNYISHMNLRDLTIDFLVFYGEKGAREEYVKDLGCRVFYLQSNGEGFRRQHCEFTKILKDKRYDIVHIHAMTSLKYRYAKIAKKIGVPTVIYHSHTSKAEGKFKILHALFKGRLNRWCDYKFACSRAAGQYMYRGQFQQIYNAIDLQKFSFSQEDSDILRKRYRCEKKLVIGNIARLIPSKNHLFLFSVAERLLLKTHDFRVVIVGDGPERENLEYEISRRGLKDHVILVGQVDDAYRYYSMIDIMAFPSKYEGLSMVMVEAQANGCKIIGSDQMSDEVVLTEDIQLLPIDEKDVVYQEWADRCLSLMGQPRNNNQTILREKGYDIGTEAQNLEDFYLNCK